MSEMEFEPTWRVGFDTFRTPRRYGLGLEMHFGGRFLVGVRIGSLWVSWGWQVDYSDCKAYTTR